MSPYYLAIDIGASSGRHILGWLEDGKIRLEEVYRFANGQKDNGGTLCWDTDYLFASIKAGIKKCKEIGKIPAVMGIDTWAVDFVLLDDNDKVVGKTAGYRDSRTEGMDEEVYKIIPEKDLYARTGIQKQIFNTIYQLMAVKKNNPEDLDAAKTFLMIPDYFNFLLTGKKCCEYTNATTTQLVSPKTKVWDKELIEKLGYPAQIFPQIGLPGSALGGFLPEIQDEVGFDCQVVLPATHDTGSAVIAVPALKKDFLYISSGTWSLLGTERMEADCSAKAQEQNFTNEGGIEYRFRYLKNIMGLWMIQSVKKELDDKYGFGELCSMAEENTDFPSRVDVNKNRFLAPANMIQAIKDECAETGQKVPKTPGEIACVIYQSLGMCYAKSVAELEESTGKTFDFINIVGGGANAGYLNQITANHCHKRVYAGPTEGTAIGNLVAQMMYGREFSTLEDARKCIFSSFEIKQYDPQ